MSDEARRLAERVNKLRADQQLKDRIQLHKADVLKSKGFNFWNDLAIAFRKEVVQFNAHLDSDDYKLAFDDTSERQTISLKASSRSAKCVVDTDSQLIKATIETPTSYESMGYTLAVDDSDEIRIRNNAGGGGGTVSNSAFAVEILSRLMR